MPECRLLLGRLCVVSDEANLKRYASAVRVVVCGAAVYQIGRKQHELMLLGVWAYHVQWLFRRDDGVDRVLFVGRFEIGASRGDVGVRLFPFVAPWLHVQRGTLI